MFMHIFLLKYTGRRHKYFLNTQTKMTIHQPTYKLHCTNCVCEEKLQLNISVAPLQCFQTHASTKIDREIFSKGLIDSLQFA